MGSSSLRQLNLSLPLITTLLSSHAELSPLQLSRLDQMGQNLLDAGEQSDEGEHAASVCRRHHQGGDGVTAWRNDQVGWTKGPEVQSSSDLK